MSFDSEFCPFTQSALRLNHRAVLGVQCQLSHSFRISHLTMVLMVVLIDMDLDSDKTQTNGRCDSISQLHFFFQFTNRYGASIHFIFNK